MDMGLISKSLLVDSWQPSTTGQKLIHDPPELTWAFPQSGCFYLRLQCPSFLLQWKKSQRSEITETKKHIWNRRWVELGIWGRGQQWEPFKDYGHLCKCPKGTRQMLGGHPTYGELEFFLPLVFKTILLGTSCNKFQVFWNNMHSEHFLKF